MAVGLGSFLGGISRFLIGRLIQHHASTSFPLGTLAVNILGCFLVGLLLGLSERGGPGNAEWRLFLTVFLCLAATYLGHLSTKLA